MGLPLVLGRGESGHFRCAPIQARNGVPHNQAPRRFPRIASRAALETAKCATQWHSCTPDARQCTDDARQCTDDARQCTDGARRCTDDARGCTDDARGCTDDARGCTDDARGCTDDARGCTDDARGCTDDARGCTDDARGCADDARGRTHPHSHMHCGRFEGSSSDNDCCAVSGEVCGDRAGKSFSYTPGKTRQMSFRGVLIASLQPKQSASCLRCRN
jgi:hypothetical protein